MNVDQWLKREGVTLEELNNGIRVRVDSVNDRWQSWAQDMLNKEYDVECIPRTYHVSFWLLGAQNNIGKANFIHELSRMSVVKPEEQLMTGIM